jgi:RimJ/RimL family protein N-acetyltransferase
MTPLEKWASPISLPGRIVCLEPLQESHIPLLAEAGKDSRIFKYMIYGNLSLPKNMDAWVKKLLEEQKKGENIPFTVFIRDSNKVVGTTRFMDLRPEHRSLEIGGTWFSPEYQGTKVNLESKYLLLKYAFTELSCIRVQFKTDIMNERSIRAIEKLGALREGVFRNHYILPDGRIRDSVFFSILDSEWPNIRTGLEKRIGA